MKITLDGNKKITAHLDKFTIHTDLPLAQQGEDTAPTPFQFFLSSIGCCVGIFIKDYCDFKSISAEGIQVFMHTEWDEEKKRIGTINIEIQVPEDFPEKYESAIINVAKNCKVKKHLHPDIVSNISIVR